MVIISLNTSRYTQYTFTISVGGVVDYGSGPYNVTFPAGQVYAVFYIIINDDNIVENSEMFNLTISSFSLPSEVNVSKPDQVTVTIEDNDGKYNNICNIVTAVSCYLS